MADSIAEIAWYIGSKGLIAAAEHFTDDVYDFLVKLSDTGETTKGCDPLRLLQVQQYGPYFTADIAVR